MKLDTSSIAIALIALAGSLFAEEPKVIVMEEPGSRWSVSAGLSVRSIQAGFSLGTGSQAILNWANTFEGRSGRGDAGLYQGGAAPVVYDNGFVGGENLAFAGFGAEGQVNSASQIFALAAGANANGNLARTLAFDTVGYAYPDARGINLTDSEIAVGPSLDLAYHLGDYTGTRYQLLTGWSYVTSDHTTGSQRIVTVTEERTDYSYVYDYVANPNFPLDIPGPVNGGDEFIVFDPDGVPAFFGTGLHAPRSEAETDSATRFYAVGQSDLNVRLNELPFGLDASRRLGPLAFSARAGITLNVIDYDLTSSLAWYEQGISSPALTQRWRDSGTHFKVGLFTGVAAKLPLTADERFFVETSGSYRWVDPVHSSAGIADVEIDPSSWEGRIGLGFVLD